MSGFLWWHKFLLRIFFSFFSPNPSYVLFQTNQTKGSSFFFFLPNADMRSLLCCSISLLKMRVLLGVAILVNTFFSGALLILFVQCPMLNFTSLIIIIQNCLRSLVLPQWKIPKIPFLKAAFASLTDDFARSNRMIGKTQDQNCSFICPSCIAKRFLLFR